MLGPLLAEVVLLVAKDQLKPGKPRPKKTRDTIIGVATVACIVVMGLAIAFTAVPAKFH